MHRPTGTSQCMKVAMKSMVTMTTMMVMIMTMKGVHRPTGTSQCMKVVLNDINNLDEKILR